MILQIRLGCQAWSCCVLALMMMREHRGYGGASRIGSSGRSLMGDAAAVPDWAELVSDVCLTPGGI
jgi:hypothetical protein